MVTHVGDRLEMGKNPDWWGSFLFGFHQSEGFGSVWVKFCASTENLGSVLIYFVLSFVWFYADSKVWWT